MWNSPLTTLYEQPLVTPPPPHRQGQKSTIFKIFWFTVSYLFNHDCFLFCEGLNKVPFVWLCTLYMLCFADLHGIFFASRERRLEAHEVQSILGHLDSLTQYATMTPNYVQLGLFLTEANWEQDSDHDLIWTDHYDGQLPVLIPLSNLIFFIYFQCYIKW